MYVRRRRGFGADCAYEGDPTCLAPCYPVDFVGPLPAGSSYCAPSVSINPASCYATNFVGPLPPGSVYCAPGSSPAQSSGCPAGSTCTIFQGVPNTAVYVMAGLLGSFLLLGALHK
jgi:hypothetical protein